MIIKYFIIRYEPSHIRNLHLEINLVLAIKRRLVSTKIFFTIIDVFYVSLHELEKHDPGVPNSCPFKADLLAEAQDHLRKVIILTSFLKI